MEIKEFKAPSYRELRPLRPLKDVTTDTFPHCLLERVEPGVADVAV
jgi:hypothetical protein